MPAHKRGPWSQAEDSVLLNLVHTQGAHNWVRISSMIQTRSPKQCRERYHQNLKPHLNHDPITPEEGALIEQMVAEMGKRWAEIARRLHGRSDNAVKNWWNGGQNRRRRNQQRRAEMDSRPQGPMGTANQMIAQHGGMPEHAMYYQQGMAQRTYYEQQLPAIYQQQAHIPQNLMVPHLQAAPMTRRFETPLPSPSAYSQLSAEGAPSLISDSSAGSVRSPYPMNSPLDLPPLSAQRTPGMHNQRLGVPGYQQEEDYNVPSQIHMGHDGMKRPQMLQEAFNPYSMQAYRHSQEFAAPQVHSYQQQSPLPHIYAQMDQQHGQHPPTTMAYQQHPMSAHAQHGQQLQLPSFGEMKPNHTGELRSPLASIDPSLEHKAPERDQSESPKERMRLSSMINA
ncbi:hypothetical protein MBLNU457_g2611t1 [Dothideomycetes sp. NU457]